MIKTISVDKIQEEQIKLLESPGKTLTTLHKKLSAHNNGTHENKSEKGIPYPSQIQVFRQFDRAKLSQKIKNMFIKDIKSLGTDANANLRTLSLTILKMCFSREGNQEILQQIKSYLYSDSLDLSLIKNFPKQSPFSEIGSLSNREMKKIIGEFFHILQATHAQQLNNNRNYQHMGIVESLVTKYPLALQVMVVFLRSILQNFNIPEADNYSKKISTTASFEVLLEFLDLFYSKNSSLYLFRDENIFIQNGYHNQEKQFVEEIVFGIYFESEFQYKKVMQATSGNGVSQEEKMLQFNPPKAQSSGDPQNSSLIQDIQTLTVNSQALSKEAVNPFLLMIPQSSGDISNKLFNSAHTDKSRKSSKNSKQSLTSQTNGFGVELYNKNRNFNLASNRSESSIANISESAMMNESQCDNPTPSFNPITDEESTFLYVDPSSPINANAYFQMRSPNTGTSFSNDNKLKGNLQQRKDESHISMTKKVVSKNRPFVNQMKESATINVSPSAFRNKNRSKLSFIGPVVLKSSLMQELQKNDSQHLHQRGSIQIEQETMKALGLKGSKKEAAHDETNGGLDTTDSPSNQFILGIDSMVEDSKATNDHFIQPRQRQSTVYSPTNTANHHQKQMHNEDLKSMKRSQSERNSLILKNQESMTIMDNSLKHSPQQQQTQSLFGIQCKKLKTSIQVDENSSASLLFGGSLNSQNAYSRFTPHNHSQATTKSYKEDCSHSAYSCSSCSRAKSKRNKLVVQAVNVAYEPNFTKKKSKTMVRAETLKDEKRQFCGRQEIFDEQQSQKREKNRGQKDSKSSLKKPSKLNDQFFRNLRAKREKFKQDRNQQNNNRNQSADKLIDSSKARAKDSRSFIKYSQFIQPCRRQSPSKSRTSPNKAPNNTMKNIGSKKIFPQFFQINHLKEIKENRKNRKNRNQGNIRVERSNGEKIKTKERVNKTFSNIASSFQSGRKYSELSDIQPKQTLTNFQKNIGNADSSFETRGFLKKKMSSKQSLKSSPAKKIFPPKPAIYIAKNISTPSTPNAEQKINLEFWKRMPSYFQNSSSSPLKHNIQFIESINNSVGSKSNFKIDGPFSPNSSSGGGMRSIAYSGGVRNQMFGKDSC